MTISYSNSRTIEAPANKRYPHGRKIAFDIRGDGMNACRDGDRPMPICDGATVIAIDLSTVDHVVQDGRLYVIERRKSDGDVAREVRRAYVYTDRIELLPESTNPKYIKLVLRHDDPAPVIKVIALVYSLSYQFQL
jgi:hypothetical protein